MMITTKLTGINRAAKLLQLKKRYMTAALLSMFFMLSNNEAKAQSVKNSSYINPNGEKILRLEFVVPLSKTETWQYFADDEKLKLWIAPVAHIDLKTGGTLATNYDKNKSLNDTSAIRINIINYLKYELLTLKVNLNGNFSKKTRAEDKNLQEVIQFIRVDNKHTRVISSMIGWGTGPDWDKTYKFFVKGNEWTYQEFMKLFKKGN